MYKYTVKTPKGVPVANFDDLELARAAITGTDLVLHYNQPAVAELNGEMVLAADLEWRTLHNIFKTAAGAAQAQARLQQRGMRAGIVEHVGSYVRTGERFGPGQEVVVHTWTLHELEGRGH